MNKEKSKINYGDSSLLINAIKEVTTKTLLVLICLVLFPLAGYAQDTHKYWIQFTDKQYNNYSVDQPGQFLSPRAVSRRVKNNIPVLQSDLPVTCAYKDSLKLAGCDILNTSKWLNGAIVTIPDTNLIDDLLLMNFISEVKHIYSSHDKEKNDNSVVPAVNKHDASLADADSGEYLRQIQLHNGDVLHKAGFMGKGIYIAVIDAGFSGVDKFPGFDSLFINKQVLATRDFVDGGSYVFDASYHGTSVLSVMAANEPKKLIGTAPEASYLLLRSEDIGSEYIIEEYNWACAAEYADSLGADIINSSVGYVTFDDEKQNHTYSEFDGESAVISLAAKMAASKGMLVVNSAGNKGDDNWRYIVLPADADSMLTVGAVDSAGKRADFSSVGPTADGRIKPDVMAMGKNIIVYNHSGNIKQGSGTSFSAPIISGLAACLWQANPDVSKTEIINVIKLSASQSSSPESLMGYGIPDFMHAHHILKNTNDDEHSKKKIQVMPNPFNNHLYLGLLVGDCEKVNIEVITISGKKVYNGSAPLIQNEYNVIPVNELNHLDSGIYILNTNFCKKNRVSKIIKY